MIHEDERRILEDWPEAKIITAKADCVLGDHYHKVKTEKFILSEGSATMLVKFPKSNGWVKYKLKQGLVYNVPPGTRHKFEISKGSVLVGLCSHPYDPNDDYR